LSESGIGRCLSHQPQHLQTGPGHVEPRQTHQTASSNIVKYASLPLDKRISLGRLLTSLIRGTSINMHHRVAESIGSTFPHHRIDTVGSRAHQPTTPVCATSLGLAVQSNAKFVTRLLVAPPSCTAYCTTAGQALSPTTELVMNRVPWCSHLRTFRAIRPTCRCPT